MDGLEEIVLDSKVFVEGDYFYGKILGTYTSGRITIEDGEAFLCQDTHSGKYCTNKYGYAYSYVVWGIKANHTIDGQFKLYYVGPIKPDRDFIDRLKKPNIESDFKIGQTVMATSGGNSHSGPKRSQRPMKKGETGTIVSIDQSTDRYYYVGVLLSDGLTSVRLTIPGGSLKIISQSKLSNLIIEPLKPNTDGKTIKVSRQIAAIIGGKRQVGQSVSGRIRKATVGIGYSCYKAGPVKS